MNNRTRVIPVLLTALCCGCDQQKLTQESCVVTISSTFAGTSSIRGQITVAKNGAPCGMALAMHGRGGGGFVSDPRLVMEPAHGSATARMSEGAARVFYSPAYDYTGPDRFVVAISSDFELTVDVNVVSLP